MTGRWIHRESEEEDRFAIHMPTGNGTGSKTRSRKTALPYRRPEPAGVVGGLCVSRSKVRRPDHEYDRDGKCYYCTATAE